LKRDPESPTPALIAALQREEAWPHAVRGLELRETHISWVFLTGDYVYKIKKPVDFGFLDFSTPDKRKFYCEEEVRLNRRLAPGVYLDVAAICGSPDSPNLAGQGQVFEYAVRMRQFDPGQGYDELLKRGKLAPGLMNETADLLASFQAGANIAQPQTPYGGPAAVLGPVQENFEQVRQNIHLSDYSPGVARDLALLEDWSLRAHERLVPVFQERKQAGFVRECHGDLHLRNIIHWQGQVIPFDCIEFSPGLRWIDVMSDLAFLLMDLDDHGRNDLSARLLDAYLQASGDYAGLQVLRFYQVYRAMVRCKVASLRLAQGADDRDALVREVTGYIALARRYTRPVPAKLLITHGLSGSGKTWVTQRLLEQSSLVRLRSDIERKRMFNLQATARSSSDDEQLLYHPDTSEKLYARMLDTALELIAWGFPVVVDAAFLTLEQRQLFRSRAERNGIPFVILYCLADEDTLRARVVARSERGDDASDADLAILEQQLKDCEPLAQQEEQDCITVESGVDCDLQEVLGWLAD
jgi:aminoglycoside phosphotransferase family enzyme